MPRPPKRVAGRMLVRTFDRNPSEENRIRAALLRKTMVRFDEHGNEVANIQVDRDRGPPDGRGRP